MSIFRRNSPMSGEFASSSSRGEVLVKRMFTKPCLKEASHLERRRSSTLISSLRQPAMANHPVRQRPKLRCQLCLFASLRRAPTSVCSVFVVKLSSFGSGVYVLTQGCQDRAEIIDAKQVSKDHLVKPASGLHKCQCSWISQV